MQHCHVMSSHYLAACTREELMKRLICKLMQSGMVLDPPKWTAGQLIHVQTSSSR